MKMWPKQVLSAIVSHVMVQAGNIIIKFNCFPNHRHLYTFSFLDVIFFVDALTVHFTMQTDEFRDNFTVALVFHETDDDFVL